MPCNPRGMNQARVARRWGFETLVALGALASSGCSDGPTSQDAGPVDGAAADAALGADTGTPAGWTFETVAELDHVVLERDVHVVQLRARRPDGGASYLLHVRLASASGPQPVLVAEQPYEGIDWTGEDVDARWATRTAGTTYPDVEAPAYDGDDVTTWGGVTTPRAEAEGQAVPLLNGIDVVVGYGRFYAGGDVADDILDATAPYHYIAAHPESFDPSRIGALGMSWGGLMALYGAASAPAEARPVHVAAIAPPSDFADMIAWAAFMRTVFPDASRAEAFFSPYERRIVAATGGSPSEVPSAYAAYSPAWLCAHLEGVHVLVPHDEWDTLVPERQTVALASTCPDLVEPLYWLRRGAVDYTTFGLDHFVPEPVYPSAMTFATVRLVRALTPTTATTRVAIGHEPALESFYRTLLEASADGEDIAFARDASLDLMDRTVQLYDPSTSAFASSRTMTTMAVNATWGTALTEDALEAQLRGTP